MEDTEVAVECSSASVWLAKMAALVLRFIETEFEELQRDL